MLLPWPRWSVPTTTKPLDAEKCHEIVVSVNVLGDAVDYLNHASELPVGNAAANMDAVFAGA